MDIRDKLQVAVELANGKLLSEAAAEIDRLREQIATMGVQQSYKPGTELEYLIKSGRVNGFRLIYNRDSGKEQAATDLLNELRNDTGLQYGEELRQLLLQSVKDICTSETIS